MSNRSIKEIIKQWQTITHKKKDKPTLPELRTIIQESPNSLKAKLAVNPHAKILASPLRFCTFHSRFFPSKLLLRFGQAYHPPTKLIWAYPTLQKQDGKGVYVNLSKKVLQLFSKGSFRAAFRGAATYRSDMTEHVEELLFKETFDLFSKIPFKNYSVLTLNSPSQWTTPEPSSMGYQCILLFDTKNTLPTCDLNHQTLTQNNIPCYHMQQFWNQKYIQYVQNQLKTSEPFALGVPKNLDTLDLSIALWRCRKFLDE